jgi:hypothetical protein
MAAISDALNNSNASFVPLSALGQIDLFTNAPFSGQRRATFFPGQRAETGTNGGQWISPNQTFGIFEGTEQIPAAGDLPGHLGHTY